ncbi:glycoside hydrolase family 28 protein [Serpula lacrymans var. lacrymans S7.3]|uniref:galacturonan 1,4-alpha-galacturonidase n=2 Tax=Serpula lacrymans var. lacrymans TaxID=341189 RepID=F8QG16_SERL3|nr:glycoside hydrolase family 28 protein [Serpula lacrymans var. lacrymans S7.9]EGN92764.1 glycoside hydrolase family 28 protein [Serpula lacrymans var. lacrymans S7.3]EGO26424.1 glycoside hydrolase family 28 protein [Serpula lacrymans var. lacrymans S7.9]
MRIISSLAGLIAAVPLLSLASSSPDFTGVAHARRQRQDPCTLFASGGDDGPIFVDTLQRCDTVLIPPETTLSIATRMNTTGLSYKNIDLQGTIKFTPNMTYWIDNGFYFAFQDQIAFWILGGNDIKLFGGGTIDGSGQVWYDAFASNDTLLRPILLTIYQATNVAIEGINMINGPEWINFVNEGQGILYDGVNISAVSTSENPAKNTDGWDIYRSDNVVIINSQINNGDDCVSLKPNSTNIVASNLNCNGSHGISVGSLGQYAGEYDIVENFTSTNVRMANAENGARIKAFAGQGVGSGIVKNVTYSFFTESNVDNPLVIDQCYETTAEACAAYPSNVYIQDIWFDNFQGTSSGNEKSVVASLACSPDGRCSDINVNNITLTPPTQYGNATYTCQNVNVTGDAAYLFGDCATTGT